MSTPITITEMPDGTFRAACPSLPGCVARARSSQEAAKRMAEAVRGYLASLDVAIEGAFASTPPTRHAARGLPAGMQLAGR